MKIEQKRWTQTQGWQPNKSEDDHVHLVLGFGDRMIIGDPMRFEEIKSQYPKARIVLASTSGNILNTTLDDESIITTAITFESDTQIRIEKTNISNFSNSEIAGKALATLFSAPGKKLQHMFVLSDGHFVNGSELVKGICSQLPPEVVLTGGLAGDSTRFEKTIVGLDAPPKEGEIVAIGFYGSHIKFGFGSIGGWDPFGLERKVTRSINNRLYELDGKNALDLYKKYLGDQAEKLPSSALLFPLAIRKDLNSPPLVRTILSINEEDQSMIFAGDIPEGWYAQLMKANFDRLIDGASQAASESHQMLGKNNAELAILISCVGRRLVLDQRTEEEIEGVKEVIGNQVFMTGFYSYGEIAPTSPNASCQLHNQTMTITTITEDNV